MTEGFLKKRNDSRARTRTVDKDVDKYEKKMSIKMHPGSKLQFEILKELNHVPRHGYEIFGILKEKGLLTDRSDVYKVIRTMKSRGIIDSSRVPSNRGYPKEILRLTEKGKDIYVQQVIDSLRENEALMSERLASTCGLTMMQIVAMYIDIPETPLRVLVDNGFGSHDRVLPLIQRLFEPAAGRASVVVRGLDSAREWVTTEAERAGIKIIKQSDHVPDGSVDIAACIGYQDKPSLAARLDGPGSLMRMLKPGGLLIAIFFKEENRPCCARYDILADEFSGIQKQRFLEHFQLDANAPGYRPSSIVSNAEIVDLLRGFPVVDCLTILDFFDVFIAKKAT